MKHRAKPELAMNWSRTEQQLVVRLHGAPVGDGRALVNYLDQSFLFELEQRGYDLHTLRFSIRKSKADQQIKEEDEDIA